MQTITTKKGFVVPLIIAIAVILVAGGMYWGVKSRNAQYVIDKGLVDDTYSTTTTSTRIIYPKGGETFQSGQTVTIKWNVDPQYRTVGISLVPGTPDKCKGYTNNGSMGTCKVYGIYNPTSIHNTPNTGSYDWVVGSEKDINNAPAGSGDYVIRMSPAVEGDKDVFSGYFKIRPAPDTSTPSITSRSPSSGSIGTTVELRGTNLAGFEGDLDAIIENATGETAFLPGIGSVPRSDQTIRVKIESRLCKQNNGYSGLPCTSFLAITPGTYKIYTAPWGKISNKMQFTVVANNSSQPSITVLSPNGGETFRVGVDPLSVSWLGRNLTSADGVSFSFVDTNGVITGTNAMGSGLDLRASGGSASLMIPSNIKSGSYRLKITDNYGNNDSSDNYFTITN